MTENATFDFNTVIETAKKIVTQPRQFFEQMPKTGGYSEPLIFAVVMGLAAGVLAAIFSFFSSSALGGMSFGIISIILMPIFAVIGCFISGLIMFVIWKLMGSSENYETAVRCVAYSTVIMPLIPIAGLIPYLGTIAIDALWFWLMFLASLGVHKLEQQKSMIVFGVLALIMIMVGISGERTQRQMEDRMSEFNEQMGDLSEMTPEEIGKAAGELLKGLQEGVEGEQQE